MQFSCRKLAHERLYWALHEKLGPLANQCKKLADVHGVVGLFQTWADAKITTMVFFQQLLVGMECNSRSPICNGWEDKPNPIIQLAANQLKGMLDELSFEVLRDNMVPQDHIALPIANDLLPFQRACAILEYLKTTAP